MIAAFLTERSSGPRAAANPHPLAAAAFAIASRRAANRTAPARLLTGQALLALAAQFLQASADRREIVGSARTAHRSPSPSDQALRATPPGMMEAKGADGQTPAAHSGYS